MKKNIFIIVILFFISKNSFGQINDPMPNFESETFYNSEKPSEKWNFSLKPYKKITTIKKGIKSPIIEFDTLGRTVLITHDFGDFTSNYSTKYKNNDIIEKVDSKKYKLDKNGKIKGTNQATIQKIIFNNLGEVESSISSQLQKDSTYKNLDYRYYDKKNRLISVMDTLGKIVVKYYYSKSNLIKQENIYERELSNKSITERIYKYNNDNQIYFSESSRIKYVNNKLIEKKVYYTVNQIFKNKLLIKKVLTDDNVIDERIYDYDDDKNLISFIKTKKNTNDGMITLQEKYTRKYENNILIYSDYKNGIGTDDSTFSFTYKFYTDDKSLSKTETTYDNNNRKGNLRDEYFYNEYGHLIKIITTDSNKSSQNEINYEIEYY